MQIYFKELALTVLRVGKSRVFMGSAGSLEHRDKQMSHSILRPSHILRLPHRLHEEGQVLFYPSLPLIR